MKKVFFKNSKGNKLCGLLTVADADKGIIAILCHGHSSGKNSKSIATLDSELVSRGVSVFRFDFYGNGESEGKFEDSDLTETSDDALQAIAFAKSQGFKKIILMGSSFGGLASIIAASKTPDLTALVLKSPVSDYYEVDFNILGEGGLAEWKKKGFIHYPYPTSNDNRNLILNYSFVEDYQKYDAYKEAEKISVPTLIVHGDADESVPYSQSVKLSSIIKNSTLVTIPGADHRYTLNNTFPKMMQAISDFIIGFKK